MSCLYTVIMLDQSAKTAKIKPLEKFSYLIYGTPLWGVP